MRLKHWLLTTALAVAGMGLSASAQVNPTPQDIVLYPSTATVKSATWQVTADATAAGGNKLRNPNASQATVSTPLASPADYFEMTFQAPAGVPYRMWMRLRADGDSYTNDSCWVQFSSTVNLAGTAQWRIGSTSATAVTLEEDDSRGMAAWGWQDNGYGFDVVGDAILFGTSGTQTLRVQRRDDGLSIDQIVLSPSIDSYLCASPGAMKNDTRILAAQNPSIPDGDIILWAGEATVRAGDFNVASDATAAGGSAMVDANPGLPIVNPLASPSHYFEMTFTAQANVPYHIWIRGKAALNNGNSDSVHAQFTNSVNSSGAAMWRIGTTSAHTINLVNVAGGSLNGWCWQDKFYVDTSVPPIVRFATAGTQTIRIQRREDGIAIDQIVLSPVEFFTNSPGALQNDTTILAKATGAAFPVDNKLRICEWNIHNCYPTSQSYNREWIGSTLAMTGANLIGLNEVNNGSGHPAFLEAWLEAKTGVQWYSHWVPQSSGATFGNLILSKFPFNTTPASAAPQVWFLAGTRSLGKVQVRVNNTDVNFMVTHLDESSSSTRSTEISQILSNTSGIAEPKIIVGDFNCLPSAGELTTLKNSYWDGWQNAVNAGTATSYPDNLPSAGRTRSNRIDFMFYGKTASALTLLGTNLPDIRDPFTYGSPGGPTNNQGHLLANGISTTTGMVLNTADDKGIRPSDHNLIKATFSVP